MFAISDRTRSMLYGTSAALLVVWSAGTASFERTIASEPAVPSEIQAAASGKALADTYADPTLPPIAHDPFASHHIAAPITPAPVDRSKHSALHVPDIDGSGSAGGADASVSLRGIISGMTSAASVAIVDAGHGTQFVHVGDALGGRTIVAISPIGISFSDGTRLNLGSGGGERSAKSR